MISWIVDFGAGGWTNDCCNDGCDQIAGEWTLPPSVPDCTWVFTATGPALGFCENYQCEPCLTDALKLTIFFDVKDRPFTNPAIDPCEYTLTVTLVNRSNALCNTHISTATYQRKKKQVDCSGDEWISLKKVSESHTPGPNGSPCLGQLPDEIRIKRVIVP